MNNSRIADVLQHWNLRHSRSNHKQFMLFIKYLSFSFVLINFLPSADTIVINFPRAWSFTLHITHGHTFLIYYLLASPLLPFAWRLDISSVDVPLQRWEHFSIHQLACGFHYLGMIHRTRYEKGKNKANESSTILWFTFAFNLSPGSFGWAQTKLPK